MPPTDAIPSIVWPGPEGAPAWAIPVQIPSGTRGYALFVPMVPASSPQAATASSGGASPSTGAAAVTADPAAASSGGTSPSTGTAGVVAAPAAKPAVAAKTGSSGQPVEAGTPNTATGSGPADTGAAGQIRTVAQDRPAAAGTPAAPPRPAPVTRPTPQTAGGFGPYEPLPPSTWRKFLDKNWPGPATTRGRAVPAGVLAGALGFAVFLPLGRVGIGWFLAALTLTAGVVAAVRSPAGLSRAGLWTRTGWAAAALALLLVPAFRNAWWLVTFSVLGALGCATLAIVGGQQVRSILFGLFGTPFAALRGLPWVRRHLQSSGRDPGLAGRVVFSAVLTIVILLVFGGLLSSADVAFSALLDDLVPDVEAGPSFQWVFLAVLGGLLAVSGIYTLSAPPVTSGLDTPGRGRFGLVEWAPASFALVLLFAGFVGVQFTVLFGGSQHVLKTSGLSYAEYARSGFWQLAAVTVLSLAVLAALARWAKRDRRIERILLRVLLGLLCALSVVIVASALSRMWEYQRVYSFTGERIFVMSLELLLGTVFVLIAVAGIRWRGRWIPQATVGLAVVMLLGLAVLGPEGYVASRNAMRYEQTGKIDAWYLRALSADATPELAELPDPVRRCTLSWIAADLEEPDPWYGWNLGRARARAVLADLGKGAVGNQKDCRRADQFDLPKTRR